MVMTVTAAIFTDARKLAASGANLYKPIDRTAAILLEEQRLFEQQRLLRVSRL